MLEGYIELFELCIAMVTALLGLAYPLFIDKINQMSDKYKTRRISEKFKNETAYCCFNILIVVCIVELFVFPIIIIAYDTDYCNQLLITIQGICVFTLSVGLYFIIKHVLYALYQVRFLHCLRMWVLNVECRLVL